MSYLHSSFSKKNCAVCPRKRLKQQRQHSTNHFSNSNRNILQSTMKINLKGKIKTSTRNNYSLIQKLAIVDRANITRKKPTARGTGIAVSMIQRWVKQQEIMLALANKSSTDVVQFKQLNGNGFARSIVKEIENGFRNWFDFL